VSHCRYPPAENQEGPKINQPTPSGHQNIQLIPLISRIAVNMKAVRIYLNFTGQQEKF